MEIWWEMEMEKIRSKNLKNLKISVKMPHLYKTTSEKEIWFKHRFLTLL